MPKLSRAERDALPASAFAYIDSQGERRLPIHDAKHVRNALARFGRVQFEDEVARERARKRLLTAAARYGIMPLGFITSEIAVRDPTARLPSGQVTFLLSDVEGSTELVQRLGDGYAAVIEETRGIHRTAVSAAGGREVDARGDEFFAAFADPAAAASAALEIHQRLAERHSADLVKVRIGVHTGSPTLASVGYIGVDVHVAARVSQAAHGGQTLVTADARRAVTSAGNVPFAFHELGTYRMRGLRAPLELFQLESGQSHQYPEPRGAVREL
jgi:class 3 adenylate cyclase